MMTEENIADAAVQAPESASTNGSAIAPDELARLTDDIIAALKTVYDPEIPADIYELGLIYGVEVSEDGRAEIRMTLTAPACPVAGALVEEVAEKSGRVEGVSTSHVELVWDPPWTPDNMTEAAKLELGMI